MKLSKLPLLPLLLLAVLTLLQACKDDDDAQPDTTPQITSFSPTRATTGAAVVLTGKNFSTDKTKNQVKFNGVTAEVTQATATELTTVVPTGATSGKITVTIGDKTASSTANFTVDPHAPLISAFSPEKGDVGTEVEIMGTHFETGARVYFGGLEVPAANVTVTNTKITAKVPTNALTGKVKVISNGLEAVSATDFTVAPRITSITASAEEGHEVIITGANFSEIKEENTITFGGGAVTTAEIVSASKTQLVVKAPVAGVSGKVAVAVAGMMDESEESFSYITWRLISHNTFPNVYSNSVSFVLNGKIYLGLGTTESFGSNYHNTFSIFDPATKTWAQGPSLPSGFRSRQFASAIVHNGEVYLGLGFGNTGTSSVMHKDWWKYNANATGDAAWTRLTDHPDLGYSLSAFAIQNKILVGPGYHTNGKITRFDPTTNSWHNTAVMTSSFAPLYAGTFIINDVAYVGGGFTGGGVAQDKFRKIDPSTPSLIEFLAPLPEDVEKGKGFALKDINNKEYGYIIEGEKLFQYDPAQNQWSLQDDKVVAGIGYVAVINNIAYCITADGKVYQYAPR